MIQISEKMQNVHSDIRGPLFYEALELEKKGINVLKLNTGNPAAFAVYISPPDTTSRHIPSRSISLHIASGRNAFEAYATLVFG